MNNSITNYCYVSHAVQWQQSIFMFYRYVTVLVSYLKAKIILNKTFKLLLQQSTNHRRVVKWYKLDLLNYQLRHNWRHHTQYSPQYFLYDHVTASQPMTSQSWSRDGISANDISELITWRHLSQWHLRAITWRRLSQWHLRADHVTASQPMTSQSYHQSYDNILLFISDNITHRCLYKIKN